MLVSKVHHGACSFERKNLGSYFGGDVSRFPALVGGVGTGEPPNSPTVGTFQLPVFSRFQMPDGVGSGHFVGHNHVSVQP